MWDWDNPTDLSDPYGIGFLNRNGQLQREREDNESRDRLASGQYLGGGGVENGDISEGGGKFYKGWHGWKAAARKHGSESTDLFDVAARSMAQNAGVAGSAPPPSSEYSAPQLNVDRTNADPETKEVGANNPALAKGYTGGAVTGPDRTRSKALQAQAEKAMNPGLWDKFVNGDGGMARKAAAKLRESEIMRSIEDRDYLDAHPELRPKYDETVSGGKVFRRNPDGSITERVTPEAPKLKMFDKPLKSAEGLSWIGDRGDQPVYEKGLRTTTFQATPVNPMTGERRDENAVEHTITYEGNLPFHDQPTQTRELRPEIIKGVTPKGTLGAISVPHDSTGVFDSGLRPDRAPREEGRESYSLVTDPQTGRPMRFGTRSGELSDVPGAPAGGIVRPASDRIADPEKIRKAVEDEARDPISGDYKDGWNPARVAAEVDRRLKRPGAAPAGGGPGISSDTPPGPVSAVWNPATNRFEKAK